MATIITRDKVIDCKIPLALLYEQMIYRKEITRLSELDYEKKLKYWNETRGSKFERIIQAQALYMFDLMTEDSLIELPNDKRSVATEAKSSDADGNKKISY